MSVKAKIDNITFNVILILLFISFFEESALPGFSLAALVSVFLIPVIILYWFFSQRMGLSKADKNIALAFLLVIFVQICGIRFNALYNSLTPIYRSVTSFSVVIYIRRLLITDRKCNAFLLLSILEVLLGFLSFLLPEMPNGNVFYGNLNTIGVLFFTFFALNVLIYFRSKRVIFCVVAFLDVIIILISNTRTALLLAIITLILFLIIKMTRAKNIRPKIFFSVTILLSIAFVAFYYIVKETTIYDKLNELSQSIFHKNFDSGRPDLWHYTTDAVGSKWLFGQGTGVDLENFILWAKTSHSVYFDVYLQNGVVGVALFLISIFVCLNAKGKWTKSNLNIFIMVIAFIIIFYNAVGIVFIKPRSGIGLLHWGLVALRYGQPSDKRIEGKKYDKSYSSGLQRQRVR